MKGTTIRGNSHILSRCCRVGSVQTSTVGFRVSGSRQAPAHPNASPKLLGRMLRNASAPRNVSNKECRIVWGLARYKCKIQTPDLNDTETDEVSELLSTDLLTTNINVRRLGRRLAVITDSYAAQEEEETIAGTGTGGDGDDGTDGDGDNDGDDAGDHASTSHGLLTAAYSVSAALLSLLFV